MTAKDKIKEIIPIGIPFTASEIADKVYPNSVSDDTEGRVFNRAIPTVARILRKMKGVHETAKGIWICHREPK